MLDTIRELSKQLKLKEFLMKILYPLGRSGNLKSVPLGITKRNCGTLRAPHFLIANTTLKGTVLGVRPV